jgi:SAM-dependent methyltransferase
MIATWSVGAAGQYLGGDEFAEQARLVRQHPWWRARAELTLALLDQSGVRPPARVLDAGCGWGVTFRSLERRGYRTVGLDVSRPALELLERERSGRTLVEADLTQPLPEPETAYAVVLALDVIEHLDDDRVALAGLGRFAAPGGLVVVSVPALPELYSEFDEMQGHRRRYLPETLRDAFTGTGLEVERVFWWGEWLVPVLRRQRRGRSQPPSVGPASARYNDYLRLPRWPGPLALRALFAWEQGRTLAGSLRTGTSLFAIARRPR